MRDRSDLSLPEGCPILAGGLYPDRVGARVQSLSVFDFSCSSCRRPHRSTRPNAIHPSIFPIPCKLLNQSVLACYSLPCIPKLILAEVPPLHPE
jgi:hypothetical protein